MDSSSQVIAVVGWPLGQQAARSPWENLDFPKQLVYPGQPSRALSGSQQLVVPGRQDFWGPWNRIVEAFCVPSIHLTGARIGGGL